MKLKHHKQENKHETNATVDTSKLLAIYLLYFGMKDKRNYEIISLKHSSCKKQKLSSLSHANLYQMVSHFNVYHC